MENENRFNPHLTGYGLEVQTKVKPGPLLRRFNPHLTGYGLEGFQNLPKLDSR